MHAHRNSVWVCVFMCVHLCVGVFVCHSVKKVSVVVSGRKHFYKGSETTEVRNLPVPTLDDELPFLSAVIFPEKDGEKKNERKAKSLRYEWLQEMTPKKNRHAQQSNWVHNKIMSRVRHSISAWPQPEQTLCEYSGASVEMATQIRSSFLSRSYINGHFRSLRIL